MTHPPVRKALGQHFLHRHNVIDAIIHHFNPQDDDVVVEIGPGRGALTESIAPRVATLHAVEFDRRLAERLAARARDLPTLVVHRTDALCFDYCAVGGHIRVIGNLPYNISTPLLFRLLDHSQCIQDMTLMLQKEVAERVLAEPGSKAYGRLSVMVQQRCHGNFVLRVAPDAFTPPPKVDSAVVKLVPDPVPRIPVNDPKRFFELVKKAFSQRRKTLHNALKGLVSEEELEQCSIAPNARAEQISVARFAQLSNRMTSK